MDRISIHGLALEAIIGIHDWERRARQPVKIDLTLFCDTTRAATTDAIFDTINYGDVARLVDDLVSASEYYLIESLAGAIASAVLSAFDIERLICTVSKPNAVENADNVSVTIERSKQ